MSVKLEAGCPFCESGNTVRASVSSKEISVHDLNGLEFDCIWCHRKFKMKVQLSTDEKLPKKPKKDKPVKYSLY